MCCYFYKGASEKYKSAQCKRYSRSILGHERKQALMASKWLRWKVRDKLRAEPSGLSTRGASSRPTLSTRTPRRPGQATGEPGASASKLQNKSPGRHPQKPSEPQGSVAKICRRAGGNMVTPHSLASHGGLLYRLSVHIGPFVQDVKYQRPENENSNESAYTHAGTRYWQHDCSSESRAEHSPKDGAHGRPLTIPAKAHSQSWQCSCNVSLLYRWKTTIWSSWHCGYLYFYWQKSQEKSQVRPWRCISQLLRYINNQIWRAANKNRINIISILINLQARGLEKQSKTEQREMSVLSAFPLAVCPWQSAVSSPRHSCKTQAPGRCCCIFKPLIELPQPESSGDML